MATSKKTIDFLLEQLADAGRISAKKMFGEYCLYSAGKPIALVCDDQLFLKPTLSGRSFLSTVTEGAPYPGAKPHLLVTADLWDDSEWLSRLVVITANELARASSRDMS